MDLSIVVPAYNEEARLPKMMEETVSVNSYLAKLLQYLEKKLAECKWLTKAEIVIVNDGSKDKTLELIKDYSAKHTTDMKLSVRGVN